MRRKRKLTESTESFHGNFNTTMAKIKKIQGNINDLKAILQHAETMLEEKFLKHRRKQKHSRSKIMIYEIVK